MGLIGYIKKILNYNHCTEYKPNCNEKLIKNELDDVKEIIENDKIKSVEEDSAVERIGLVESVQEKNINNFFIDVYDMEKIFEEGKYKVGIDIPVGEYYFWGYKVMALDGRGYQINSDEMEDFYLELKKGRVITVEGGKFTIIDNIKYKYKNEDKIIAKHMYRIGKEIPTGVYTFFYDRSVPYKCISFAKDNECSIEIYTEYPCSKYELEHAASGIVNIDSNCKYLKIFNGFAKLDNEANVISDVTRRLERENLSQIYNKLMEEKDKENNIFENGKIYFYASIGDIMTEILINNYYECEKVINPYRNDECINYKFCVSDENVDEIRFIKYLYYYGRLHLPLIYNVPINKYYIYVNNQGLLDDDEEMTENFKKLKLSDINSFFPFLKHVTKIYPARLLLEPDPIRNYEFRKDGKYVEAFFDREECDNTYKERLLDLQEKGLVNTRWKSEFSLYILVKEYYSDAKYQYRANWLEQQSLDIFIPSIKVAIEYQGIQHYEAVDLFGGSDALEYRKKLDDDKKKKCLNNDILLIEWKYDTLINDTNLLNHFLALGIKLPQKHVYENTVINNEKNRNCNEQKENTVIYQYDMQGNFVNEYSNVKVACENVGSKGVGKVLNGLQNTAGGYYWKRVKKGYPKNPIELENNEEIGVTSASKSVVQMNDNGDIISVFNSISEAAKAVGVGAKSIRLAASAKQKHAGGYCWQFLDDKKE